MIVQRLPKWFDARLHQGPSRIAGMGLFASSPVRPGEVVMRWGGVTIKREDYNAALHRPSSASLYDEAHCLVTPVGEPKTLDEFLNHSCDPNLWMIDAVTVGARRPIEAGEEITTDYAMWNDEDYLFTAVCQCRTPLCRGRITGQDWRIKALQFRYEGHFVPSINRRIEPRAPLERPLSEEWRG